MSLIHEFMPGCSLREVDRVAVAATPERAWAAVRAIDLSHIPFIRWLFALRLLPQRIRGRLRGGPPPRSHTMRIEDIVAPGNGFVLLGEEPGRELVVGSIGRFWQPRIDFVEVTPERFTAFEQPGFGKLTWNLRVDPREGGGSWIGVELRVTATDAASWARFRRYWWLIGRFSRAIRKGELHRLRRELGPARSERQVALPGDELIPMARLQRTHARTLDAPPSRVWPWLVQMGCQRGGWYSLDRLDNAGIPSADRILPRFQHLSVGDIIPARPTGADGFGVLRLEPERLLVLGSPSLLPGRPPDPGWLPYQSTWAFVLQPVGRDATRLLVRVRADYRPGPRMALMKPLLVAAHELMERAQLRHLGRRVAGPPVLTA
ncbi:SRPBCC family protein [Pyxidicoccus fallax]|uniref:SRPBCC family protein n=1 Tax=Pyxidicoccus fallax TaxID=394095 RepID=A0A848LQK7_9BACT|nr:SRPBCC family protein [Pyxidicoccus fallax]NMO20177.1 SRPBCC family protein [Pyxidicoccus fallax]NPC81749.1 SRPBCC family protein [Pyxidicoccus fallax]